MDKHCLEKSAITAKSFITSQNKINKVVRTDFSFPYRYAASNICTKHTHTHIFFTCFHSQPEQQIVQNRCKRRARDRKRIGEKETSQSFKSWSPSQSLTCPPNFAWIFFSPFVFPFLLYPLLFSQDVLASPQYLFPLPFSSLNPDCHSLPLLRYLPHLLTMPGAPDDLNIPLILCLPHAHPPLPLLLEHVPFFPSPHENVWLSDLPTQLKKLLKTSKNS